MQRRLARLGIALSCALIVSLVLAGAALADWQTQTSNTPNALDSTSFANLTTGWAVGLNGTILATGDGGAHWSAQSSNGIFSELYGVSALDSSTVVAVGEFGMFLKTTDGGATWVHESSGLTSEDLLSVSFAAGSQTGYAVTSAGHVFKSTDGGGTWAKLATVPSQVQGAWKVSFRDAQHGMIAGQWSTSQAVLITADGGATWSHTVVTISGGGYLNAVTTYDATHALAVGVNGTILRSGDDGASWATVHTDATYDLYDVRFADASTAYAVGTAPAAGPPGTVLRTDNGGATWTAESNPSLENLNGLAMVDPATAFAVDDMGGIIKYTDTTPPTVTSSADSDATWHRNDVTVSLSPADMGGSKVQKTQYRLHGNGSWTDTSSDQFIVAAPADHTNDGTNVYDYRALDNAGNISTTGTATVHIDTRNPGTVDNAPAGWKNADTTVTLTPTDVGGAGIAATHYQIDGTGLQSGTSVLIPAPASHANDGLHTITYYSTDTAGNVEPQESATVRIDTRNPGTTDNAPAGWYNTDQTVTLTPTDVGGAGVASTSYKVDSGSYTTGTSVLIAAPANHSNDGSHTITYYSTDTATNAETPHTATVNIDTRNPGTTDNAPAGWQNADTTVTLTPVDVGGAGIASTHYQIDGGTLQSGTSVVVAAPADHSADGNHTIAYYSADTAGNVEVQHTVTVHVDTRNPGTTDNAPVGWKNADTTVTLTPLDVGGAGIAATHYQIDGGALQSGTSVLIAAPSDHSHDGSHTITYYSTDTAGNVEAQNTATVRIDTRNPGTTDNAPAGWQNADTTVTLVPVDVGGAGVASTSYKVDSGSYTTGTSVLIAAPANHSNDGSHTITYYSTDTAGNAETPHTATVRIDTRNPATTDNAPVAWQKSATTVTLTPVDVGGAGIASTSYKVDSGALQSGTSVLIPAPADGSNDGSHTITYYSTDTAGNVEAQNTVTVRIDATNPTTSDNAPVAWQNAGTTVTLTPSDARSGVAATHYKIDTGALQSGTSVLIPAPADGSNNGVHTIAYYSTDVAGNVEAQNTATVRIDATIPTVTSNADGDATWHNNDVTVTLSPVDTGGSGVAKTQYRLQGSGAWLDTTGDQFTVPSIAAEGPQTYEYQALDHAGNASVTGSCTIKVDTIAPNVPDSVGATYNSVGRHLLVTYTVTESVSMAPLVDTVTVTDRLGRSIAAPVVYDNLDTPGSGALHNVSVTLTRGSYRVTVAAADEAGNVGLYPVSAAFSVH